jgi:quercetin dioxygenase-like cupin family protein
MNRPGEAVSYRWDDMPRERLTDLLERRVITAQRIMLAHIYLKKGCVVPKHFHENEQVTYLLEGALRFRLGEDQREERVLRAGGVLVVPSNLPHSAEALEDTLSVDVFSPPRQDWLDGTDDYLRQR